MSHDIDEDEFDFSGIAKAALSSWKSNFIIVIVAGVFSYSASLFVKDIYQAEVVMIPAADDKGGGGLAGIATQLGGMASLAGISLSGGGSMSDANVAILKSRDFTNKYIEEKNLLPLLFADKWDVKSNRWLNSEKESPPTLWDAYNLFDKSIRNVRQDTKTGIVTLTMRWTDPTLAARWANDLVDKVNEHTRFRAIEQAEKSSNYLEQEIDKTSNAEMREVLYRLIEKQKQSVVLAQAKSEFAFQIIDHAVVPEYRVYPVRSFFALGGSVFGMLIVLARALAKFKSLNL